MARGQTERDACATLRRHSRAHAISWLAPTVLAGALTLLERKRLEMARALATGPKLLLLDEIAGGLTEGECRELVETIREIHAGGITIIWIEHVVHALLAVVGRLIVLNFGRKIAEGAAARGDELSARCRQIYMGIAGMTPVLETRGPHRLLRRFPGAVRHRHCVIAQGETVAIIGANGAGKSTFCTSITGLLRGAGRAACCFDGRADRRAAGGRHRASSASRWCRKGGGYSPR